MPPRLTRRQALRTAGVTLVPALAGDRALVGAVGDGPGSATLFEL